VEFKDKDVKSGGEGNRPNVPDKVIDISEGIQALIDLKGNRTLDQLRQQMESCCLQACNCCLQIR
jgi:hypothetical protein